VLKVLQVPKVLKGKVEVQDQRVSKGLKVILVLQVEQVQSDHHLIQG
jgi:hypothetical protein